MDKYYELSERYLRDLVAINTVNKPGNEKAAALYISRELERYNFKTEIREVAEGRANVVASIGGSSNGNTVIFTGHLDVVPPGENWKSGDPFTLLEKDGKLYGTPAVIDKDFASAKLAELLDADMLVILTAVEKVAINFGKPDQKGLDTLTPDEARKYIDEKQFAPGSMLPKVQAAMSFAESKPGRVALITLLEKAAEGIEGKTGTRVQM